MEFNELCPTLLDRWIGDGRLPNFAALRDQSEVFLTQADVTDPVLLEPWIQWYSAHTGLAYDQHRVFRLTDGPTAGFPDIYTTLIGAGLRVGSFSSMNVAPFAAEGSFFVSDPWTELNHATPAELNIYTGIVARQVREYSNASAATGIASTARFTAFLLRHGLSPATVMAALGQIASEKLSEPRLAWRRATILDRIQFDVFRSLYRSLLPDFATFFINSTAHFQHSYWRHLDPDAFSVKPDAAEMALYRDAVLFGYQAMDRLVGRFQRLAEQNDARLIFMTALSQQPFLRYEEIGGQRFHRLHNVERFLGSLDLAPASIQPTMTHQYMVHFDSVAERDEAAIRLKALRLDGREIFGVGGYAGSDVPKLYFGCQIATETSLDATVVDDRSNRTSRFGELFYRMDAIKSGRHHPDGALWIQHEDKRGRVHETPVSILDFFPTLLDLYGLPDDAGAAGRRGKNLLPQLQPA
jgi:hypothetical protein